MKPFAAVFLLQLRRLLRSGPVLACLLALPALVLGLALLLPRQTDAGPTVEVGVLLPQNSPAAESLWQRLEANRQGLFHFNRAQNQQQLKDMVAANAWECGYLMPEDLDARIGTGSYNRLFTRVQSPATTLGPLVDWQLAAALMDVCAPQLVQGYVQSNGIWPEADPAQLQALLEEAFAVDNQLVLEVLPVGSQAALDVTGAVGTAVALVRGGVAVVLLLFACLVAVRFAEDLALGFFARLRPFTGRAGLVLPSYAAALLPAGLVALLALGLAGLLFPGQLGAPAREVGLLALYLLYLAACSLLLAVLFKRPGVLVCLLPFVLVACLLLCPIFVDLSFLFPGGRVLAGLLPPTLYLRAAAGHPAALWQMAAATLGLFGLAAGLFSLKKRRNTV